MTMDKRDKEALDAHITGQHEDAEECTHPYISWHGGSFSRGECQDCGEIISAPANPDTDRILTKLFDQWRDDIANGRECTIPVKHDATQCNGEHHDPERWTHET